MDMTARQAAETTGGRLSGVPDGTMVTSVTIDSRTAGPGSLFVALPGARTDGHAFAAAAVAGGAVLTLASRPVPGPHVLVPDTVAALGELARHHLAGLRAANPIKVVAITGSVGKTTAKDLTARVLAAMGPTVWAKGSYNNHLGLPLTILSASWDTEYLVLEMGANHIGEIAALAKVANPDVGVVLGVAAAHVGEFGSLEAVAAAKAELLAALAPTATAVLNLDDPMVGAMPTAAGRMTFGFAAGATVRGTAVALDGHGRLTVDIDTPLGPAHLVTALAGAHLAPNVLAAAAVGTALGATPELLTKALTGVTPDSPHRMALAELRPGVALLDDSYNANPASTAPALRFLAHLAGTTGARAWAVLGEMRELGPGGPAAHRELGQLAAQLGLDRLDVVGEGAQPLAEAARTAGMPSQSVHFHADLPSPPDLGIEAAANTIILVKGSNSTGLWRLADALAATAANPPWPGREKPC